MTIRIILILITLGLASCSNSSSDRLKMPSFNLFSSNSSSSSQQSSGEAVELVSLTAQQTTLVETGVKKAISFPETAEFKSVKAVRFAQQPGVHVCGFVKYASQANSNRDDVPFYVELRKDGQHDVIKRGQIATDKSKLGKINFVCRHHKNV